MRNELKGTTLTRLLKRAVAYVFTRKENVSKEAPIRLPPLRQHQMDLIASVLAVEAVMCLRISSISAKYCINSLLIECCTILVCGATLV